MRVIEADSNHEPAFYVGIFFKLAEKFNGVLNIKNLRMKKLFLKLLIPVSALAVMSGCTYETSLDDGKQEFGQEGGMSLMSEAYKPKYDLDKAVWHEETESGIVPVGDPYRIENVKEAYEIIKSGNSSFSKISASVLEKLSDIKIEPTHYNVKIWPRTEQEQLEIEMMDGIAVSYIPFDYVQIPENELKAQAERLSKLAAYSELTKYNSVHENVQSREGVKTFVYNLPVLYAVWPCDMPFPSGMDYEILYEVHIPDISSGETGEILSMEAERLSANVGEWGGEVIINPSGYCYRYDDFLGENVPLSGLKLKFQSGSNVYETVTRADGGFSVNRTFYWGINSTVVMTFQGDGWKLTKPGKTSAIVTSHGLNPLMNDIVCTAEYPVYEVHSAVQYLKETESELSRGNYIRIEVSENSDSSSNGTFYSYLLGDPHIIVYNNGQSSSGYIGTTFHELGHNAMYSHKGYTNNSKTDLFLKESYGKFSGWYLTQKYYLSLGVSEAVALNAASSQSAQSWHGIDNWDSIIFNYSPLFIDLVDDFNQRDYYLELTPNCYYHGYSDDNIAGVPAEIVENIAFGSKNQDDFVNQAKKYIGVYYSQEQFDRYFYNTYSLYWGF